MNEEQNLEEIELLENTTEMQKNFLENQDSDNLQNTYLEENQDNLSEPSSHESIDENTNIQSIPDFDSNQSDIPQSIGSEIPNETIDVPSIEPISDKASVEEKRIPTEPTPVMDTSQLPRYVGYKNRLTKYIVVFCFSIILLLFTLTTYFNIQTTSFYSEKSSVEYQVCLSENEYYSTKCVGENVEYLSAISDIIRADFTYNAVYQEKDSRSMKYYIKSDLLIKTINEPEKELLSKEKKLTEVKELKSDGNIISLVEPIDIPFQEYNDYAQKYKNDYSLLSNSQVIISLVNVEGDSETVLSSITVPLTKSTYNISKYELKEQNKEYVVASSLLKKNIILGITIILGLVSIFAGIKLLKFALLARKKESKYEKKLKQILNTYDRVIVTLNDNTRVLNEQEVYTVKSFLELLDVRDTIDKPILYYKVNNVKTEFYVQDINKVYKYTMKEADFED